MAPQDVCVLHQMQAARFSRCVCLSTTASITAGQQAMKRKLLPGFCPEKLAGISESGLILGTALVAMTSASHSATAFSQKPVPPERMSPTRICSSVAPYSFSCLALCTQQPAAVRLALILRKAREACSSSLMQAQGSLTFSLRTTPLALNSGRSSSFFITRAPVRPPAPVTTTCTGS